MKYAIVVIDIGMTNKKVAVYDENLQQLDAVYKNFEPILVLEPKTDKKIEAHDLKGMELWFFDQIAIFAKKYPVKAITVSTHGATCVCLDKNGTVSAPCLFYTYEPGDQFQNDFYALCGSKINLQQTTCTPPLSAMINLAKGIYFLQQKFPEQFSKTKTIVNYPQYWGYLFTGVLGAEPTFLGCHTYLLDPYKDEWSSVVDALHIKSLMPENYRNTYEALGKLTPQAAERLGLSTDVIVTMGIHDSNASLLPYLAKNDTGDFILNSTGTWCVCMHPQDKIEFEPDELGKIVFYNQSVFHKPVKTSIFLGGMEVDTYVKLFQKINNMTEFPSATPEAAQEILTACDTFILPEIVPGSGQYPFSKAGVIQNGLFYSLSDIKQGIAIPPIMHDINHFFAVLDLSLVIQTETALKRAGLKKGTKVFTEGGFRKNKLYNGLLASVLNTNEAYLTSMKEATALGAAMTGAMILEHKTHTELAPAITIEYTPISAFKIQGYENYREKWLTYTE